MREKSILGSASLYWSELTLWQKLMGGVAISGLPAAASIITNIA